MYCPACYYELIVPAESTVKSRQEMENGIYGVDAEPIDVRLLENRRVASIPCSLCHAMLAAPPEMIGKEIECPDCGTKTVVPMDVAESRPRYGAAGQGPPPLPASISGPGVYGISDVAVSSDENGKIDGSGSGGSGSDGSGSDGSGKGRVARAPSFPVWCRLCGTIMHATEDQIGTMLTCPDCLTQTIVRRVQQDLDVGPHQTQRFEGGSTYEIAEPLWAPGTKLVPVVCQLCATRMYAAESEIGGMKICPDCGRETPILDVPEKEKYVYEVPGGAYGVNEAEIVKTPMIRAGVDYRYVEGSLDREHWNPDGTKNVPLLDSRPREDAETSAPTRAGNLDRIAWGATPRVAEDFDRDKRDEEIRAEALRVKELKNRKKTSDPEKEVDSYAYPEQDPTLPANVPESDRSKDVARGKAQPTSTSVSPSPPAVPAGSPVPPPLPPAAVAAAVTSGSVSAAEPIFAAETIPVAKTDLPVPPTVPLPSPGNSDVPASKPSRKLTSSERVLLRRGQRLLPRYPLLTGLLTPFLSWRILSKIAGMITVAIVIGLLCILALWVFENGSFFMGMALVVLGVALICAVVFSGMLAEASLSLFSATAGGDDEWSEPPEYDFVGGTGIAVWLIALMLTAATPGLILAPTAPFLVPGEVDAQYSGTHVSMVEKGGLALNDPIVVSYVCIKLSFWLLFPLMFLGAMENGSYINPVSGRVLRSLFTAARRWIAYYALSLPVVFLPELILWPTKYVALDNTPLFLTAALLVGALFALIVLLYFRILGRHAWTLVRAADDFDGDDD